MARIVWEYGHGGEDVCAAILDADRWPIRIVDFRVIPGARFVSGPLPMPGTDYVGTLDCQVTEVQTCKLISVQICATKRNGSTTSWKLQAELIDRVRPGTTVVINIDGVDPEDPQERILLSIIGTILNWICAHAACELDQRELM